MDSNYIRIVNAIIPSTLILDVVNKTGSDRKQVEQICLELVARVLGDGKGLNKDLLKQRLKAVAGNEELKNLLSRLNSRYGITMNTASKVLSELLPILFRNISELNDAIFVSQPIQTNSNPIQVQPTVRPQVEPAIRPQVQPAQQVRVQTQVAAQQVKKDDSSVDDVYKNIENKAKISQENKANLTKKQLKQLKKKQKLERKKLAKDKAVGNVDDRELSLVEKICMIAVFLALIVLIGSVVILFLKNR